MTISVFLWIGICMWITNLFEIWIYTGENNQGECTNATSEYSFSFVSFLVEKRNAWALSYLVYIHPSSSFCRPNLTFRWIFWIRYFFSCRVRRRISFLIFLFFLFREGKLHIPHLCFPIIYLILHITLFLQSACVYVCPCHTCDAYKTAFYAVALLSSMSSTVSFVVFAMHPHLSPFDTFCYMQCAQYRKTANILPPLRLQTPSTYEHSVCVSLVLGKAMSIWLWPTTRITKK